MTLAQDSRRFWRNDPILDLLKGRLNLSDTKIIIVVFLFTAILHHFLGIIADYIYVGQGMGYSDPRYLYFNAAWLLIITPLIWILYLWQPKMVDKVLDSLQEKNAIGDAREENHPPVESLSQFRGWLAHSINRKIWYILALIPGTLYWIQGFCVTWPADYKPAPPFWIEITWFTPFLVLGYSMTFYVLWLFVVRHVQIIYYFNRLFHWFRVEIRPVYPDEAGGLGTIGEFTVRTGMVAVAFGLMAVIFGVAVWGSGGSLIRVDVLTFFALYIVVTPLCIILPMLGAHRAMKEARSENLEEVSQEFARVLSDLDATISGDGAAIKNLNEKLSELRQTYHLIHDAFPVWPISIRLLRNFSITASLPLLWSLVSILIEHFAI